VRSRCLETLLVVAVALVSRWAHADPSPVEISAARHAFEAAVSLENAHQWRDATAKLREALAVKDTPGLRFHLAHCEAEQGLLVEAELDYDRASELLQKGAKAPDVEKLLAPASAALRPRVPRVLLALPSDLLAPVATIDGKVFSPSELELGVPLDPGRHELLVSASGRRTFQRSLVLKEGEQSQLRADLPPVAPAPAKVAPPPVVQAPPMSGKSYAAPTGPDSQPSLTKLYLMVGESAFTVAGLALGIGYQLAEASAGDRVTTAQGRIDQATQGDVAACGSPDSVVAGACSDLHTAIDDHDRAARVSMIGFVTAGVGAAALLTTWLAYPSSHAESTGVVVQPAVGFGRVGLLGRF
ncbi:MAG TPA: hypothetical protein VGL19_16415, partial [Polyangiaceae bacterium]